MSVRTVLFAVFLSASLSLSAQDNDKGTLSGNFQTTANFYERDDRIGANTEVYKTAMSSVDAWLFLNYEYKDFSIATRFDGFQNSPLLNPQGMYTKQGIGFWQVNKKIAWTDVTIGYFYEQFASGMLFRAYEDRNIGIDFAVQGVRIKANPVKNLRLTGFSGQQKGNIATSDRFDVTPQVISGLNSEYRIKLKDNMNLDLGASAINRVLDRETMSRIRDEINSYPVSDRFKHTYNVYAFNGYGTFQWKNLSLYGEYCYKSPEATPNQAGTRLFRTDGNIFFGSASYSKQGLGKNGQQSFGINAQYKRIDNFRFRTTPYESLLNGMISYLPSITRQNTYRLLARYNSVVQELGEQAFQADFIYTPKRGTSFLLNVSHVQSLSANGIGGSPEKLFQEVYMEVQHKFKKTTSGRQFAFKGGIQGIFYNQDRYEIKPGYANVVALTPFGELTYKYRKTKSLRFETQYLATKQDLGSFINLIVEWNLAPKWSFAVGDMVNHKPYRQPGSPISDEIIHYYSFFAGYTKGPTQFTLAYIKQVEGVNCTGGICRVEPAFSGLRFTMLTSF